jgi:putative endonuclease
VSRRARGNRYEKAASEFLQTQGYRIITTNYHFGHKEIDIICLDGKELVFVEVKGGRSLEFGDPVYRVDARKQAAIAEVARAFLAGSARDYDSYRFDVVTVKDDERGQAIEHLKGAFTL